MIGYVAHSNEPGTEELFQMVDVDLRIQVDQWEASCELLMVAWSQASHQVAFDLLVGRHRAYCQFLPARKGDRVPWHGEGFVNFWELAPEDADRLCTGVMISGKTIEMGERPLCMPKRSDWAYRHGVSLAPPKTIASPREYVVIPPTLTPAPVPERMGKNLEVAELYRDEIHRYEDTVTRSAEGRGAFVSKMRRGAKTGRQIDRERRRRPLP